MTKLASLMTRKRNKMETIHLPGLSLCSDLERNPIGTGNQAFLYYLPKGLITLS